MDYVFGTPPRSCSWLPAGQTEHGTRYRVALFDVTDLAHPRFGPATPAVLHLLATSFRTLLGRLLAVYLPGEAGERNEDPSRCVGVVTALDVRGSELVATVDIRDRGVDLTRYDVSATVSPSYLDTSNGRPGGPAVVSVDLRPNGKAAIVDNTRTPGLRFRIDPDGDGVARRVGMPDHLVDHHVARLSAEAEGMGLTRSADTGTTPRQPGTAQLITRYTHLADELGLGASGSTSMPSLGRG
ncbi:hypothetical protein [Modestobacter sp. Leaf380]|uniref:hypothetical protein n=1 Tax=Modestobacter sp. Leaf380 TaxID=1736356 RepID=UPI0006F3D119|nr:hypothetical protein [Modestobacter sp. Leaf380]KQS66158.1 hypothetical protein ASG41_12480 [Modestobacter sp. Leaf380]